MASGVHYRYVPFTAQRYQIGSDGSVWSCLRRRVGEPFGKRGEKQQHHVVPERVRQLKPQRNSGGYYHVLLYYPDGSKRTRTIHVLMLEAFMGPRPQGMACRHLNGDRKDNRLSNLRWGTSEENEDDKARHGTKLLGESHHQAKLTEQDVREIRAKRSSYSLNHLAEIYRVSKGTITFITTGKTWKHLTDGRGEQ